MVRRLLRIALGLAGAVLLLAAGALLVFSRIDLKPRLEARASAALGRNVTVGRLEIGWGAPLHVGLGDLRIANADWGSAPEMVRIAELSADLALAPLLRGVLHYDRLAVSGVEILLERDSEHRGNWRFAQEGAPSQHDSGGLALVPKNRRQFPTMIDMGLQDAAVIYRVPGKRDLRIDLKRVALGAPNEDAAARLLVEGAYNGLPARLEADTESFARLRDAAIPFGVRFTLDLSQSRFRFDGTLAEPLDFEGVAAGRLDIESPALRDLMAIIGSDSGLALPLTLAGEFSRDGDHWRMEKARGSLAGNVFSGALTLDEGSRGKPDAAGLSLAFERLDAAALAGTGTANGDMDLRLEPAPGVLVDAQIQARELIYGGVRFGNLSLRGRTRPGAMQIEHLSFALGGGRVTATLRATAEGEATRLLLESGFDGVALADIATHLGIATDELAGPVSGRLQFDSIARKLQELLPRGRGQAVLAMSDGRVARALVEKASTDLRSLFRTGDGWLPIRCVLGLLEMRNGSLALAPLRLRTADTEIVANGRVDLANRRFDVTIASDGGSSPLALNVPVRIAGSFERYSAQPVLTGGGAVERQANPPARLPPSLAELVARSACAR